MELSLNQLLCQPQKDKKREEVLASWTWLTSDLPVLFTVLGDVFVQAEDGVVSFLDVATGKVEEVAKNGADFQELLIQEDFIKAKFHPDTIALYLRAGKRLNPGKCYSYTQPLILDGDDQVHNLKIMAIEDHLELMGGVHEKIKDVPEDELIEDDLGLGIEVLKRYGSDS